VTGPLAGAYIDADGDSFGANANRDSFCVSSMSLQETTMYSAQSGGDCNDSTATRTVSSNGHQYTGADQTPGKAEKCEGYDSDCDGVIDDGCPSDFTTANLRDHGTYKGTPDTTTNYDCPSGKVMSGIRVHGKIPLGFCGGAVGVFGVRLICTDPAISVNNNNDPFTYSTSNTLSESTNVIGQSPSPDGGYGWDTIP
jgi:hypothetical protein